MTLLLAVVAAVLVGIGTNLLLQARLSRIIIGLGLLGHGANLLIVLSAGRRGQAAFADAEAGGGPVADPLPQALVLTAIVIAFGSTALLLALAYRSWVLTGNDRVENDVEDRLVARRGHSEDLDDDLEGPQEAPESEFVPEVTQAGEVW